MHEFEKDILKTISKKKGSILATQKVMKYIEDMNRRRVSRLQSLELKDPFFLLLFVCLFFETGFLYVMALAILEVTF